MKDMNLDLIKDVFDSEEFEHGDFSIKYITFI